MRFLWLTAALAILGQQPAPDPFVAQHDAAAARNPDSAGFTISLPDGHTTFQPGETIPVTFSYASRLNPSAFNYEGWPRLGASTAVLDHADGTVYPLEDYDRARIYVPGGVIGGVRGCLFSLGSSGGIDAYGRPLPDVPAKVVDCPPIAFTVYLNQEVRFDRPGRYRFYVLDEHEHVLGKRGPPLVSNVLELTITPRDPAWEARTAEAAIAALDEPNRYDDRMAAARTLRFLGSDRAVDEMVKRAGTLLRSDLADRSNQIAVLVKGLFAARDRARVIRLMEAHLDNPRQSVNWPFMPALVALSLARTPGTPFTPRQQAARLLEYQTRRTAALRQAGGVR